MTYDISKPKSKATHQKTYQGHRVNIATIEPLNKNEKEQIIRITTATRTYYFSISPNIILTLGDTK